MGISRLVVSKIFNHVDSSIYNHLSNKVEDVIEGSGNREGNLVLYRNRQSTINKLENRETLPGEDNDKSVFGH
jgi:hypothetical protein